MFITLLVSVYFAMTPSFGFFSDLQLLDRILRDRFDNFCTPVDPDCPLFLKPFAGSVLRLIFHDCGGYPEPGNGGMISQCDGCYEEEDFYGGPGDATLDDRAVGPLDDIYLDSRYKFNEKMSRADFWAFAATIAVKHTRENATDNDIMPDIPYYFGRMDCSTSPYLNERNTKIKPFPGGKEGWKETYDWMNTHFDFNVEQIVAILGAHTIGTTHPDDSGFSGPWVEGWGAFNNEYYKDIVNAKWKQRRASNGFQEWAFDEESSPMHIMLNADIALYRDLDNIDSDGWVTCGRDINTCSANTATIDIIQDFAKCNQWFLNAFVNAYIKMITTGYDINRLTKYTDADIYGR